MPLGIRNVIKVQGIQGTRTYPQHNITNHNRNSKNNINYFPLISNILVCLFKAPLRHFWFFSKHKNMKCFRLLQLNAGLARAVKKLRPPIPRFDYLI